MKFEKKDLLSYEMLLKVLQNDLTGLHPDWVIRAERVLLHKDDSPFLLVLNRKEKRIGIIEYLSDASQFPTQMLSHAVWLTQNRYALDNLNKNEFNPDLPPFVMGLVSTSPNWLELCPFIKLDLTLLKVQVISHQGVTGLIFEPLSGPVQKQMDRQTANNSSEEKVPPVPSFRSEGFNEMGLTEAEIKFFSK